MIDVVGGTYEEYCQFPPWRQTFGSGGRAAAAIAALGGGARLHTFGAPQALAKRQALADAFNFALAAVVSAPDLAFDYFHALTPIAVPPSSRAADRKARSIEVHAACVLRFGMLEGEGVVHAQRAVYDPQSPSAPAQFGANGSVAQELAVVCNLGEARLLTGAATPQACAEALVRTGAAVAVIKAGPVGALVQSDGEQHFVASYRTDRVFPIGSGDVFSAVFAKAWMEDGLRPEEAAQTASRAAALYCGSMTLPTADLLHDAGARLEPVTKARRDTSPPKVYLAGPFFSMEQLWLVEESRSELRQAGFEVFSPFHDVGLTADAKEIARRDLAGLEQADLVFAVLDSLDPGTIFEVGYARKCGIPVVGFAQHADRAHLTMMIGTNVRIESDFATAIYQAAWTGLALP